MLSGSSLSCRSPPCSHTAISSTSLTVLLQASDLVRYTLSPADLNPSPPRFDLRAVRCHLLVLPFLQNFHQLTVAHSACMCHNLFAVICFSHNYFTTNEKPRRPFWATLASCFSGLFCYSPFGCNPVDYDGRLVFAEAHCGYFGTVNRARGSGKTGMEIQLEDWKKIRQALGK